VEKVSKSQSAIIHANMNKISRRELMHALSLFCLFLLISCAHERAPASFPGKKVAYDSLAKGNIKASAVKRTDKDTVCFDINLVMTGVEQQQAQPSNWSFAWVDQNEQYHLLKTNQRDPASLPVGGQVIAPYGEYQEWKNSFTTCAPKTQLEQVKTLIVSPKHLPYDESKELRLHWH
jgi:hypothetical protein